MVSSIWLDTYIPNYLCCCICFYNRMYRGMFLPTDWCTYLNFFVAKSMIRYFNADLIIILWSYIFTTVVA